MRVQGRPGPNYVVRPVPAMSASSAGALLTHLLCTSLWMTCAKRPRACGQAGKCWGLRRWRTSKTGLSP